MMQDDHDDELIASRRESWSSLHAYYESLSGKQSTHYRFRYIVARLLDSPLADRFTVGEAFLFSYDGEAEAPQDKSLEERYAEYAIMARSPVSTSRGLYFTTGAYGVSLHQVPHVVVYTSVDGANLYARYCRGLEIVSSHVCQTRKEIPCILSLLDAMQRDSEERSVANEADGPNASQSG
jgi:hypothetical protein